MLIVIDPSNSHFSLHLGAFQNLLVFDGKQIRIYKPVNSEIGPNANQFRDCIDISVKIALTLNEIQDQDLLVQLSQKILTIYSLECIKILTNQRALNENLLEIVETSPVRSKQASSSIIRQDAQTIIEHMRDLRKLISMFPAKRDQEVNRKFNTIIENLSMPHAKGLQELINAYEEERMNLVEKNTQLNTIGVYRDGPGPVRIHRNYSCIPSSCCECFIF